VLVSPTEQYVRTHFVNEAEIEGVVQQYGAQFRMPSSSIPNERSGSSLRLNVRRMAHGSTLLPRCHVSLRLWARQRAGR
jgi:hypothetical protein